METFQQVKYIWRQTYLNHLRIMAGQIYLNYLKILAGQGGEVVRVRQMRAAYLKYPFSGYLSPSTCYILILFFSGYPSLILISCTFPDIFALTCNALMFCTWKILLCPKDKISKKLLQESWVLFVFVFSLISWSLKLN